MDIEYVILILTWSCVCGLITVILEKLLDYW